MVIQPAKWWVKQCFRALFYGFIIWMAWLFLVMELYEYTRHCHRLPFQAFFSKYGITTCGELVEVTLVAKVHTNGTPQQMEFRIPTEYLEEPKYGGVTDTIKLRIAYPSFKPWYWVAEKEGNKEGVFPIEVTLRLHAHVSKRYEPSRGTEVFVYSYKTIGMDLYKFRNPESIWEKMCPTSYYYPSDLELPIEIFPIEDMRCGSLCWSQEVNCRVYVVYSEHLHGEYTFGHRKLDEFPEIDKEVRKLIEKIMHPQGLEKVYFVNFNQEK